MKGVESMEGDVKKHEGEGRNLLRPKWRTQQVASLPSLRTPRWALLREGRSLLRPLRGAHSGVGAADSAREGDGRARGGRVVGRGHGRACGEGGRGGRLSRRAASVPGRGHRGHVAARPRGRRGAGHRTRAGAVARPLDHRAVHLQGRRARRRAAPRQKSHGPLRRQGRRHHR